MNSQSVMCYCHQLSSYLWLGVALHLVNRPTIQNRAKELPVLTLFNRHQFICPDAFCFW